METQSTMDGPVAVAGRSQTSGFIGTGAFVLLLVGLLVLPFAMRPSQQQASGLEHRGRKLVVISSHWEGARYEFARGFSQFVHRTKGIDAYVEWLNVGGTADMVKFIQSEFSRNPSGIGVDMVFGGGVEAHRHLADKALLAPIALSPKLQAAVPVSFSGMPLRDPQGRWFGAALAGFGILYNKKVFQWLGLPVPRTWKDLAAPALRSWVGSGNPRASGSTHMVYEIILQAYGWNRGYRTLVRLAANVRSFPRSSAEVPADVTLGEVACGMALDSYAWNAIGRVGTKRLGYVLPEGQTVINPDAVSVLKGAPHPRLAKWFVEFVLSREGQALWMRRPGKSGGPHRFLLARMSVRPDMYGGDNAVHVNPFTWQGTHFYDETKASRRWEVLNTLMASCLIDSHRILEKAWKAVIDAGLPAAQVARLTEPPVSEQDLSRLAKRWGTDQVLRSRTSVQWTISCRKRYEAIIRTLGRRSFGGCGG